MASKKGERPPLVPVVQVEVRVPGETKWSATLYDDNEVRCTKGWIRFRLEGEWPEDWSKTRKAGVLLAAVAEFEAEDAKRREAHAGEMSRPAEPDDGPEGGEE